MIWFVGLPFLAYLLILGSGIGIAIRAASGLYGLAVATVLLIVIGIRNAWDIVVWVTQQPRT